jgi:uncharacterized membrane protein
MNPTGVAVLPNGNIVVADQGNQRIRLVTPAGVVTTLAGNASPAFADGTGTAASFFIPTGVAYDPTTGNIVVADQQNHRIRLVTQAGVVTTLAGNATATFADGTGTAASFQYPTGVAVLSNGNIVVADLFNQRIRLITPAGVVTTLAGNATATFADGTGTAASFNYPTGVAVLSNGNIVVGDLFNQRIRLVTTSTYAANSGVVTTLAGNASPAFADGTGTAASFYNPYGVAVTSTGNIIVADSANNRIRYVTASGVVTTPTTYDHTYALTIAGDVDVGSNVNVRGGYYVNGVQLSGGSAISTYSNAGAILFATGTSTGLQGSSNLFFSNSSNLGIRTTTPATALDVNGGVTIRNGYRPLYSNVTTTPLTVAANSYGTHFNITTSALAAITLPTIVWATDSNAYWVFRNNTGTYLSVTFTYTSAGTTAPTNPVTIPPANSVTVMLTYPGGATSNYVLF